MDADKKYNISGIFLVAIGCLIGLSVISYIPEDLPFITSEPNPIPHNYINYFGAYLAFGIFFMLGWGAYLIPILLFFWGINLLTVRKFTKAYINFISLPILFISFSTLCSILPSSPNMSLTFQRGGIFGLIFSKIWLNYLGYAGGIIVSLTLISVSLLLSTELLLIPFIITAIKYIFRGLKIFIRDIFLTLSKSLNFVSKLFKKKKATSILNFKITEKKVYVGRKEDIDRMKVRKTVKPGKVEPKKLIFNLDFNKKQKEGIRTSYKSDITKRIKKGYEFPPLDLLRSPQGSRSQKSSQDIKQNISILEDTLSDFSIEAKVVHVEQGPVVTLYELEPAPGVKIQKITNLSDDIALVMKAHDVRVIAPIPGKGTVGVEIPNSETEEVYLKEIIASREFQIAGSKLVLGLGKDISGNPVISDLSEMPHLLIAGATGSGKTICVNAIIMSMLFNATPDEVKFLMVDPKMVELISFNGIPHLLSPIVTSYKKVSGVLNWMVEEMERRYQLLAKIGVRDIGRYNKKVKDNDLKDRGEGKKNKELPYIVLIIDELADLMSVASKEIEGAITRLAQLSRAVGIHMILATQRPSVDVVTGIIKANFPARISFKVASKVDSRTVLDMNGADKLLGKGDMLFLKPRTTKLIRMQGSLVTDDEVERVVNFVCNQRDVDYEKNILERQEKKMTSRGLKKDEIYEDAVKVVLETGHASASMLQRRLGLGYTRAARLIDIMEEEGIVGPYRGSKARKILVENKLNE